MKYVSIDIEADGPIPGVYSMLNLGAAAFTSDGRLVDTFNVNILPLEGAIQDPDTMEWWKGQPKAWEAITKDQLPAEAAMRSFVDWLDSLGGGLVFVGYPATYDFMFAYWYIMRFVGRCPFGFSGLDIKTYAMAIMDTDFKSATKKNMPREWFKFDRKIRHTHIGVDDAIEQGLLFFNMKRDYESSDSGK